MLGKTAGGLYWMFRYLERSENTSRMIEAGFRIALTRPNSARAEWESIVTANCVRDLYLEHHDEFEEARAIDFLLRDRANPSSVMSAIDCARNNARLVRTALTREVWEAVNESWIDLKEALRRPVRTADLPEVLGMIRRQSALVRGAMHGTMLRNDVFDFCRLGTFLERADNTARILDVKYYVLLPSIRQVGTSLDNVQWETILRAVEARQSYRWLYGSEPTPKGISEFLILDGRMPRSLKFCVNKLKGNLAYLEREQGASLSSRAQIDQIDTRLNNTQMDDVFETGLHEFIVELLNDFAKLASQIETDFRFYG